MNNYFNEINNLIENLEVNKRVRQYKDNSETLETYWNIGKNLYETGLEKNKYGSNFIKEWGKILSDKYGKSYKYSELMKMKQYYEACSKGSDKCKFNKMWGMAQIGNTTNGESNVDKNSYCNYLG